MGLRLTFRVQHLQLGGLKGAIGLRFKYRHTTPKP